MVGLHREAARPLGGRPEVLVVEDDTDVRESVRDLLEEEGYSVALAGNGREALERLHRSRAPDLILLDIMMPVMDGWQLHAAISSDPDLSSIPVVVMSAGTAGRNPGESAVAAILRKPVGLEQLLGAVRRFCRVPA